MKHTIFSRDHHQTSFGNAPQTSTTHSINDHLEDFAPSPDEVARRAYFTFLNEGSHPGRDVQHWLEAESRLLAERNLTRTHGFHNHT